jgi:dTDP-4-dehydrorhamnose reductase
VSDYGRSKLAGERAVAAAHPAALLVRTSLIYGGAEPSGYEHAALEAAHGRGELRFFVDELRCPILAGDLAAAILELMDLELAGLLHVAGADALSRYEFARLVAAAGGLDPDRIHPGRSGEAGGRRPRNCALDSARARTLIRTPLRGAREVLGAAAERAGASGA